MVIELRTPLCRALGIEWPILSVGIEWPILSVGIGAGARAELAAAVSEAGEFGVIGASGMRPDALQAEVERTRGSWQQQPASMP
jgi:NAD(P)H-dependent flavin oxidoreductase YrpB (nitropropane dioxygenase family)